MGFYDDMQDVATNLLTEFKQGVITLTRTTYDAKTNPHDAPTNPVDTVYTLNSTATGVSQEYVDGTAILKTDGQVISAVKVVDSTGAKVSLTPVKSDELSIDGSIVKILAIKPLPRAGTPAAYVLIYRG